MCGVRTDGWTSFEFELLSVELVSVPVPVPAGVLVVCCVVCDDNVLKILLLSSLAAVAVAAEAVVVVVVGAVAFLLDTNIILEKVNFTGLE